MKVMVVDDEPLNLQMMEDMLGAIDEGIQASYFAQPLKALEAVQNETYDAGFLDIQMPGMSGLDLADKMLAVDPGITIVFVTAFNHYATEAFEVNAVDYLLKPIEQEQVKRALKRIVERQDREKKGGETLSIYGFGSPRIFYGKEELLWDRRKTAELFWYLLAYRGKKIHKATLCEDLWPNLLIDKALPNLQVTICRLRKLLGCVDREVIHIEFKNDCYSMHLGEADFDVPRFESLIQDGRIGALEEALTLYAGNFLDHTDWLWAEVFRQQFRLNYEQVMGQLVELYWQEKEYLKAEEQILRAMHQAIRDEKIEAIYLEISWWKGGEARLDKAFATISYYYNKYHDGVIPQSVQKQYQKLKTANS